MLCQKEKNHLLGENLILCIYEYLRFSYSVYCWLVGLQTPELPGHMITSTLPGQQKGGWTA
jgi:hypothetical protein